MTKLIAQAFAAHQLGLHRSWYDGLSDEDRQQFDQELADVTDAITKSFSALGATFSEVSTAMVEACRGLNEYEAAQK